jgi:hypothetical protein
MEQTAGPNGLSHQNLRGGCKRAPKSYREKRSWLEPVARPSLLAVLLKSLGARVCCGGMLGKARKASLHVTTPRGARTTALW